MDQSFAYRALCLILLPCNSGRISGRWNLESGIWNLESGIWNLESGDWTSEQRDTRRYRSLFFFVIRTAAKGEVFGHVVDLSELGIMILRNTPLEVGSNWRLVMELGSEVQGRSEIGFAVQVRWCRQALGQDRHECGLKIKAISRDDAQVVTHLTRNQSFEAYVD